VNGGKMNQFSSVLKEKIDVVCVAVFSVSGVARGLGDRGDKKLVEVGRGREGKEKPAA